MSAAPVHSAHAAAGRSYRGRLAPSPTGLLHLGHAQTFWTAYTRARAVGGTLVFRNDDLDRDRCKPEFVAAMFDDLRWFGLAWSEGPDTGGRYGPYSQSQRTHLYRDALRRLQRTGRAYPCCCSRRDIQAAASAPHASDDEPIYPGTCRPRPGVTALPSSPRLPSWRFLVPDGEAIEFVDGHFGPQRFVAGLDFGDFVVWRPDNTPAYQLACVVDDAAMAITEVVRGADLLLSTARQLLLYRALGQVPPEFVHCPLVHDEHGRRLAKRHAGLSLRRLRERGLPPETLRPEWHDTP